MACSSNFFFPKFVQLYQKSRHEKSCLQIFSEAQAVRRFAKRNPIGKKKKPWMDFLMVTMASGIARGLVRTTTKAAELPKITAILLLPAA